MAVWSPTVKPSIVNVSEQGNHADKNVVAGIVRIRKLEGFLKVSIKVVSVGRVVAWKSIASASKMEGNVDRIVSAWIVRMGRDL